MGSTYLTVGTVTFLLEKWFGVGPWVYEESLFIKMLLGLTGKNLSLQKNSALVNFSGFTLETMESFQSFLNKAFGKADSRMVVFILLAIISHCS